MTNQIRTTKEPGFLASDDLPVRSQASAQPGFRLDLKRSLQMHPALAATVALLVFAAITVLGLVLKPQYQATAIFSVSPVVPALVPQNGAMSSDVTQFDSTMQQNVETLQRADTAQAAVRSLPDGVWRMPGESVNVAALRLSRSLSATRVGTSLQITATLNGAKAKDTAAALSALSTQFLREVHGEEDGRATERVQLLKEEATRLENNLDADRTAEAELAGQLGVSRLQETEKTPADLTADQLRQQLADLQKARSFAAAGLSMPQQGNGGNSDENGATSTVSGLVAQINVRKATLESQMAGMTAANPIYQQDVVELRSLDRELTAALTRSDLEQLRRQEMLTHRSVQGVSQEEERVRRQLAAETGVVTGTAAKLQRYSELNHEVDRLQLRLGAVRDAISSTILQASSPSRVNLVVAPTDTNPAQGGKRRIALLAALPFGLLAGLLAAILAHRQDGRVFLAVDLEQVLGIKPMAVLPVESEISDALADQGLLRMAASIESAYLKDGSKTFVFTASSPDCEVEELVFRVQGKLKDLGYSALWLAAEALLRAERDFEEMYGRGAGGDGGFRVSESADRSDKGVDGIATQRLNWLKRDYDMVLIDAPPLLQSAIAEYAVRRTDATILVSESGLTTREELEASAGLLEQLGTSGIGAVLQDLRMRYAAPGYRKALQRAEERAALPVRREPVDNGGEWQILNAGTIDELRVPGDPTIGRGLSRARPVRARVNGRWTETGSGSAMQDREDAWPNGSERMSEESAYSSHKD